MISVLIPSHWRKEALLARAAALKMKGDLVDAVQSRCLGRAVGHAANRALRTTRFELCWTASLNVEQGSVQINHVDVL